MNTENLKKFNIFDDLSNEEIDLFTKKIKPQSYAKNEIIMKEGEPGDSILFLLSGEINITKSLTLSTNKNDAKDKIIENIEKKKIGRKKVNFNLRDWGV